MYNIFVLLMYGHTCTLFDETTPKSRAVIINMVMIIIMIITMIIIIIIIIIIIENYRLMKKMIAR